MCISDRDDIAKLSGMTMPVNKRNWLKQNKHLYLARRRKEDMKAVGISMKSAEGRPTAEKIVHVWRQQHPDGRKAVSYTHLDVYKRQDVRRTVIGTLVLIPRRSENGGTASRLRCGRRMDTWWHGCDRHRR